jgi:hypothetical protein
VLVAMPLGFLPSACRRLLYQALDPFIQMLKPISPLAWMPLALYTIKDSGISGHLRDLHLLALADADQHRVRRGVRAQGVAQRGAHARSESPCARPFW